MRYWIVLFDDGKGRHHRYVEDDRDLATRSEADVISHFQDNPNIEVEAVVEIGPALMVNVGFWH